MVRQAAATTCGGNWGFVPPADIQHPCPDTPDPCIIRRRETALSVGELSALFVAAQLPLSACAAFVLSGQSPGMA